jgi:hypothetical protein
MRTLSRIAHSPRLEDDGQTHRPDCECVRCDLGFGPSERQRVEGRIRGTEMRARERAAYEMARARERSRLEQAAVRDFVDRQLAIAEEQLQARRDAGRRAAEDERLARMLELRSRGRSLREALEEAERAPAA